MWFKKHSPMISEFQKISSTSKNKKRTRFETDYKNVLDANAFSSDGQGHTFFKLLTLICDNLTAFFASDTNQFIQADIFEQLAEPLIVKLITLNALKEHFKPFIENTVKPLIF